MARIGVLEFGQEAYPFHFISKEILPRFLGYRHKGKPAVASVDARTIRIVVEGITFRELKGHVRNREAAEKPRCQGQISISRPRYSGSMPRVEVENAKFLPPAADASKQPVRRFYLLVANAIGTGRASRRRSAILEITPVAGATVR